MKSGFSHCTPPFHHTPPSVGIYIRRSSALPTSGWGKPKSDFGYGAVGHAGLRLQCATGGVGVSRRATTGHSSLLLRGRKVTMVKRDRAEGSTAVVQEYVSVR
jgi:hypothetical protein